MQSQRISSTLSRVLQGIVLAYQALAVLTFLGTLVLSNSWLKTPFLGAFFEKTLLNNNIGPERPSAQWDLWNQGIRGGDQLLTVNGVEVHSQAEISDVLSGKTPGTRVTSVGFVAGETIPVEIKKAGGDVKEIDVTLGVFPVADRNAYLVLPAVISGIFLLMSLWIFGLRRTESAGRSFSIFASSLSLATGNLFNIYTTHQFSYAWTLGVAIVGGSLVDMAMTFPQEFRPVIQRPYLRWGGYVIAILLSLVAFPTLADFNHPSAYVGAWQNIYLFTALSGLAYFGFNIYYSLRSPSPVVKSQSLTILIGSVIGFSGMIYWMLTQVLARFPALSNLSFSFSTTLLVPLIFFPLAIGYTILRFRLLQTDTWVRQGLAYGLLTALVVGGFGLLVSGISLIFNVAFDASNIYFIMGLVFIVVILLNPLRMSVQSAVDNVFFRGQRAYLLSQQEFTHQMSSVVDQDGIARVLRENVTSTLAPNRIHIYLYESLNDQYAAMYGPDNRPTSDIRFVSNSPLVQYFQKESLPLYMDGVNQPPSLKTEEARLALLGTRLFVRLPGQDRPLGWLALGPRLSGQPYSPQDLSFLENLCEQSAIAFERAQTVSDLERRVQEMNALSRVSQGVNITLAFDDVLELIFAQTAQIIPASDFHITLYNQGTDYFYYAFCVEKRDRREERENEPIPHGYGLAQDVILKGRPLLTQDYIRECQARSLVPAEEGVYAWMGVPLNAGAETIGALSVGSRDALVNYTRGQVELLQNISDHTAGAIVKSRLLEESQRRTSQLSTLNDITRQLTSTLETEPLLQNILENAVSILNCEAGSLFLVDEQTDEMIFTVTVGPVAGNLLGMRLPPGSGIVGRAVDSRGAVIDNDAQSSGSRHAETDQQTGFVSRSLLAVPLLVKDRVIGIVEVINRRDALPFDNDDQNLLTAFAGQAAVALENARLYTLTDKELTARVEELSVMQRIDRELNASLEMDRAMRITLDWAMRQSQVEAGLIGMLESGGLRIMAQQGYGDHLASYANAPLPLDLPILIRALESGQPQRTTLDPAQGGSLLPEARDQISVPIRREAQVIGMLMLESTIVSSEDISFLTRLSDHAAIAIANAQLYNEVQAANIAKSDFVSLVAHELKNPMTSIKGYSELLAGGKVGEVNEIQANFLATIRSNVERMSTLVSDLNDNSKIEAGRLRIEFREVEVPDVVDEVVRSTRRQIEDKRQTVEVTLPETISPVWADRTRVGQVLTNLLSNAHKYTPEEGKVTLGAEEAANRWDPEGPARVVHMWVRDTGIGINAEDQAKIFQKFFRSEDQKAREAPGTGLGLNITKSLVEMQGGRIWFESEFRKGTTFHFTVPVAEG